MTVSAVDVAAYILDQKGPMTAMKLQKLVYYGQAWGAYPRFVDTGVVYAASASVAV